MPIDAKAADMISKGWYKERLEPSDCEYLLTFRDKSSEANLAVSLANRLNRKGCGDVGQICAEIEVSTGPCPCNCKFCRYAEGTTSSRFFDIEDSVLGRYAEQIGGFSDVKSIRLATCGDADIPSLCRQIGIVKDRARRGTRIYVNTRDLETDDCRRLKEAGAYGAYHACRIGEGKDTEIKKEVRLRTVSNLVSSGLQVITGVEPIGPEHGIKDIVESFYATIGMNCASCEIYGREPVPGTEFGQFGRMNPARIAQIRAVFTLASSWYVPPHRVAYPGTYVTGQNVAFARYTAENGKEQIEAARRKLFNSGFARLMKTDDSTVDLNLMYLRQSGSV